MIEITVRNFLKEHLDVPVVLEIPKKQAQSYVVIEKTGGTEEDHIQYSTLAVQSVAETLNKAIALNDRVIRIMRDAVTIDAISNVTKNSDYNFTDPSTGKYRYQAVFNITHYEEESNDE